MDLAPAPDPALFISDLQDANKQTNFTNKKFFLNFFTFYFLKVHLHHSSKIKKDIKKSQKVEIKVFLLFLLDDGRIRIRPSD